MSELEIWNELGNLYYNTGAYDEAIRTYHRVISLDPGCGQTYSSLASILVCQGHHAEAIPMFQKAIELLDEKVNKACLWNQLGDAYRKLDDYAKATTSYRKAIELDPDVAAWHEKMAEVERASQVFSSEPITDTDQVDLPSPQADCLETSSPGIEPNDKDGSAPAVARSTTVIETTREQPSNPADPVGSSESGSASWIFKSFEPENQEQEKSSEASEPSPLILGKRMLSDAAVEEEAVQTPALADGAAGSTGAGPRALLRLGISQWRSGEYERAILLLKMALEAAGRSQEHFLEALGYYAIARVETDLGKIEAAIQSYQKAALLAPDRIFPWNNLGKLNCLLDRYEDARAAYQAAIEHDRKDSVSWNGLGDVYHKLGRFEDAIAAYQLGNVFDGESPVEDVLKEFETSIDSDNKNESALPEARTEFDPDTLPLPKNFLEEMDKPGVDETIVIEKDPEKLPQTGPFVEETDSAEVAETNNAQPDSPLTEPSQKTGDDRDIPAHSEPEPAYWMFKTVRPQSNAQQPASCYQPVQTDTVVDTLEQVPEFTVQPARQPAFTGSLVHSPTKTDPVNNLVQLTPRRVSPVTTPEFIQTPAVKHDPEKSFVETLAELRKASLDSKPSEAPAPKTVITTDQPVNQQPQADAGRLENDIAATLRVTEINPKNDRAWDALGNKYEAAGQYSEAIIAFEKAIAVAPFKEVYYYHLGIALGYQTHYDQAIQALQKVIELNSAYMLAHCALAGYYRKVGKEAEAKKHASIARPSMENESEYNQACFESISGECDRAIELLEIAFKKQQVQAEMVCNDPDLDFIRSDPRFETLLARNKIIS